MLASERKIFDPFGRGATKTTTVDLELIKISWGSESCSGIRVVKDGLNTQNRPINGLSHRQTFRYCWLSMSIKVF